MTTTDNRTHLYIGTFLIALTTLALEIILARLLSVITWYHLAFFAISVAMLGMTAGAVTVYLKPGWFERDRLERALSLASLGFALATPVALLILCSTPLGFVSGGVTGMTVAAFAIVTVPIAGRSAEGAPPGTRKAERSRLRAPKQMSLA